MIDKFFKSTTISAFILSQIILLAGIVWAAEISPSEIDDIDKIQPLITEVALLSSELTKDTPTPRKVSDLISIAEKRKALLSELAKENPSAFLSAVIPAEESNKLPVAVSSEIEKEVQLTGELQTLHVDDFSQPEESRFEYYLNSNGRRHKLYSIEPIFLPSGTEVTVSGIATDDIIVAKAFPESIQAVEVSLPESVGLQRTAVFLVDFLDSGPRPFTAQKARRVIPKSQFIKFFKEQSYNQVDFAGEIYGWFTLPRNAPPFAVCGAVTFDDLAGLIAQNNIGLSNYDRLVIIPSHPSLNGGCSSVGKWNVVLNGSTYRFSVALIGNAYSYNQPSWWGNQPFEWTNLDFLLAHELGHSLGLLHANGWDCGNKTIYGDYCSHREYGNYFDAMGTTGYSLHFNALYKEMLGWLQPSEITTVSSSGKAILIPIEINEGEESEGEEEGAKAIKIQMPNSTDIPYYIEYRQAIGFDRNLNRSDLASNQKGVFVNKRIDNSWLPFSRLLDMSATAAYWWDDTKQATLNLRSEFVDPGRGIVIKTVDLNPDEDFSSVKVKIDFLTPQCAYLKPYIQYLNYPYWEIPAGQTVYFNASFINGDYYGCSPTTFQSTLSLPETFVLSYTYPQDGLSVVAPEEQGWYYASIFIPEDTPTGKYLAEYNLNHLAGGLTFSFTFPLRVCAPSDCSQ